MKRGRVSRREMDGGGGGLLGKAGERRRVRLVRRMWSGKGGDFSNRERSRLERGFWWERKVWARLRFRRQRDWREGAGGEVSEARRRWVKRLVNFRRRMRKRMFGDKVCCGCL